MKNGTTEAKLMVPMAAIVIVAVMALVGSLWVWAEQADSLARTREENLVRKGMEQIAADHSLLMTPITIWGQATESTAVKYDPKWVHGNLGVYFQRHLKFESSVLLDAEGKPRFAYHDGQEVDPGMFAATLDQTAAITRGLRNRFATDMATGRGYSADSNHAGKLVAVDGRLYIVGASLILPDDTQSPLLKYAPFSVIGMHEIQPQELVDLSDRYLVAPISLLAPDKTPRSGQASVVFSGANGQVLAQLTWQPETPGKTLFLRTIGPVLMISLGLGLVALVLLHTSQKTAQSLSASEAKAKHMALHDALTGLPNRTLFADRLSQACERMKRQGGQVAVMCIGLDRFKDVNDTLGHLAGDELIRHNASKINSIIRASDTLARLGGDFTATAIAASVTTEIVVKRGEIDRDSFYTSAVTAGITDSLIPEFAKAFAYDFDFQREINPGDIFEAAFEQGRNAAGEPVGIPRLVYASLSTAAKSRALYAFTPAGGEPGWFDGNGISIIRSFLRTPVDGARITSRFGIRVHPVLGFVKAHRGTDFGAPTGTPIYAAGDGAVTWAAMKGANGNLVILQHDNGWQTYYLHMDRFGDGITSGVRVRQGQTIGYVGTTGRSTGPHLHYEMHVNGEAVDAMTLPMDEGHSLKAGELAAFQTERDRIDSIRSLA